MMKKIVSRDLDQVMAPILVVTPSISMPEKVVTAEPMVPMGPTRKGTKSAEPKVSPILILSIQCLVKILEFLGNFRYKIANFMRLENHLRTD